MNTSKCPSCGKPNPDTVDICQFCGTALKRSATEPLPPIHPGDMPVKRNTSDLERTLPGWLRDMRKASGEESSLPEAKPDGTPEPVESVAPLPEKPAPPKQKESASPLDFLAGLAQANDEEEAVPDWLKSLQNSMPAPAEPAPTPEPTAEKPADWLSGLQSETQANEPPVTSEPNWGFGDQPATYDFDENAEATPQASQDTPDWLTALKAQDEAAHPTQPAMPPAGQAAEEQIPSDNLPDWLSSLGGTAETQPDQTPSASAPAADTPDWFSSMGGSAEAQPEQTPAASVPTANTPDWLSSLSGTAETQPEQTPAASVPTANTPDWLSSLGGSSVEAQPEQTPAANVPMADTPDWLSSLGGSVEAQPDQIPAAGASAAETPDWLSSLGESAETLPEQTPVANVPMADTPDWLSSLGGSAEAQPDQIPAAGAPAAETPDWLSSLHGGFNAEEAPTSLETNQPPTTETPDWLANLGEDSHKPVEPVAAEPVSSASAPAADLPSWLSDLTGASQPAESQVAEPTPDKGIAPTEPQPVESDVPGWMTDLQGSSIAPVESPVSQEPGIAEVPPSADVPDWMTSLQGEQPESQQAGITEPAPTGESELPSWLAAAMGEKPAEKPEEPARPRKPFATGTLGEIGPLDTAGELPDWMTKIGEPSAISQPAETPEGALDQPLGSTGTPIAPETAAVGEEVDLGASLEAEAISPTQPEPASLEAAPVAPEAASAPIFSEEQNLDSILSLDMPDWLSDFTPTEAEMSDAAVVEKPAEDNIRPADLPSWVQAMRPVEDVMGEKIENGEEEQQIEGSGPLAGLRSVLPVLPGAPEVHKPKIYSIKLQIDETQRAQAALLENLLNSESTPQVVSRQSETLVIRSLRWTIAGVLLVTVLLGALLQYMVGNPVFPSPEMPSGKSEIGTFMETIGNLPENATVLVVADYQPGFAGEMESASGPMISQLMSKNARLAFISTSPIGPYLAERLLQKFSKKYPYELGTQYVNLGYLPGGAGGIQVFAELPATTIGKDWFQGDAWKKDALKAVTIDDVTKLSNFSAVIVLTDNPDTGRLWIEQAQPSMKSQPMLMVVSAQAEPMIRPYVASGQLKGLVSGLAGGTLYESSLASPGQARSYWDAFVVAVFAAELLILVGGVWSLVEVNRARRAKKMEQDEA